MTASTPSFGLSRIGQIAMTVQDLARAIAFYRDTLGLRFLFEAAPSMAFFDCGGVRLMLSVAEKAGQSYSSVIYYKVDDIQLAFETIAARGATVERNPHLLAKMPDHDLWMAFFRDSEGNLLALMSEVRRQP